MLVFLLIFSTNIHLTQCKPCHKRSVHQICAFPSECPTRSRDECARNKPSPTAELLTSTLSSGVVTFPSVTYPTFYHVEVTEVKHRLILSVFRARRKVEGFVVS